TRPSATERLAERGAEYNSHRPATACPQRRFRLIHGCLDGLPPICKAHACWQFQSAQFPISTKANGMTTLDKREDAFEKQFAHDEELRFKATARRNKLLGLWAAEKLGLSGAEADSYAKSVVMADFEEAGDHDVLRKIRKDFDAKGVEQSDHQI